MTQNQIAYSKVREEARHNQVMESQGQSAITETSRHNKASEGLGWYTAQETARHNQSTESLGWYNGQELARHNLVSEDLNWYVNQNTPNVQQSQIDLNKSRATEADTHSQTMLKEVDLKFDQFEHDVKVDMARLNIDLNHERWSEAQARQSMELVGARVAKVFQDMRLDEKRIDLETARIEAQVYKDFMSGTKTLTEIIGAAWDAIGAVEDKMLG